MAKCVLCNEDRAVFTVKDKGVCVRCAEDVIADVMSNLEELISEVDALNIEANEILELQNKITTDAEVASEKMGHLEDNTLSLAAIMSNLRDIVDPLLEPQQPKALRDDVKVIFDTLKPGTPAYEAALRIQKQLGD